MGRAVVEVICWQKGWPHTMGRAKGGVGADLRRLDVFGVAMMRFGSDRDADTKFDDAVAGDAEEFGGGDGVSGHDEEQGAAPPG